MKCEKCGSSWDSTVNMSKCPFCGTLLEEKKPDQFDNIPDVLAYIVNTWGKETLAEPRLVSLVSDLCTGCDNELRLLRIAVQSGAYAELIKVDGLPDIEKEQILFKQAAILHRKYFIDATWASSALSWLAGCLGWNISESDTAQTSAPIPNAAQKNSTTSDTDWSKVEKPEVPGFEISLTPNGITIDKYTGSDENVTVRSSYGGVPVYAVGNKAFIRCRELRSVVLPEGLVSIENFAFYDCRKLSSIVIPDTVTHIGKGAFRECASLSSLPLSKGVSDIEPETFMSCYGLTSLNISEWVERIGDNAFACNDSITSVTVPKTVCEIGDNPFADCSRLHEIKTDVENRSFVSDGGILYTNDRKKLISVPTKAVSGQFNIPDGVTEISSYALSGCHDITSVIIPESIVSIGAHAFRDCKNLEYILIPGGVTNIGINPFYYCLSLKEIAVASTNRYFVSRNRILFSKDGTTIISSPQAGVYGTLSIPDGVEHIGERAFCNNSITSVFIPGSVSNIDKNAFTNCFDLENISISDGLRTIGDWAFSSCGKIKNINIPNSVTTIGNYAFASCNALQTITIPPSVESIGTRAFPFFIKNLTVTCTANSYAQKYCEDNGVKYNLL